MEIDNIIKREVISLITSIVLISIIFIGLSFASFFSIAEGEENVISFGDINLTFCNDTTCSENSLEYGQTIGLQNVNGVDIPLSIYPYETISEALETTPYIFNLTNTGDLPLRINVLLEEDSTFIPSGSYSEYTKTTELYANNIKIGIADCEEGIPSNEKVKIYSYGSLVNNEIINNERVEVNDSRTYCLWTWLDENTPNEVQETYFVANISVEAQYVPDIPSLANQLMIDYKYYGLTEIENNFVKEYIYQGENPDNYVSFNGEIWRIIGVFEVEDGKGNKEKRVKIIREPLENLMAWDTLNTTNYKNSTLNQDLTYNYFGKLNAYLETGLNSTARAMVKDAVWNLGNVNAESLSSVAYESAKGNTVHAGNDATYVGKVGLMNASDYGYSSKACYSNKTLNLYNDVACTNTSWLDISTNNQWLISVSSENAISVLAVSSDGSVISQAVSTTNLVRPVVYLNEKVLVSGGNGTSEKPFELTINTDTEKWYNGCTEFSTDIKCKILADNTSYSDKVRSEFVNYDDGIQFHMVSSDTNGKGLYYTEDRTEDFNADGIGERVYYFRGVVENNYLVFANYCWRIVRTNEDGSVKLRYGGTPTVTTTGGNTVYTCPQTETSVNIGTSSFNTTQNEAKYFGYTYGDETNSQGTPLYGSTSSDAKINIENWYSTNIANQGDAVTSMIANTVYCNDRSNPVNGTGGASAHIFYGAATRLVDINYTNLTWSPKAQIYPIYSCPDIKRDGYTVSGNSVGNEYLAYPVAMLTADEVVYAGGKMNGGTNNSYYLYTNSNYWLLGTFSFEPAMPRSLVLIDSAGPIDVKSVTISYDLVPAISLISDAEVLRGIGEYNNPYVIKVN